MPLIPLIIMLAALPTLLLLSALFSGSETALFSLSRHERLRMRQSKSFAATRVLTLLAETRPLLITLLLGNMTVNVAYYVICTVLLTKLGAELGPIALAAATVAPLLVVILLGEVLPKLLAARMPHGWSVVTVVPLWLFHRATAPLRRVLTWLVITPLARLIAPSVRPPELSAAELETLLELSRHRGVIDQREEHLLHQVLELNQLKVRDLMTPRVDLTAHDLATGPAQLYEKLRASHHSRLPVFKNNLDHIEGVFIAREVLLSRPQTRADLHKLVRRAVFVPELQRADQLLVQFRKTGTTMAIAVDEYGGTAGLVTLEDVVEHMVGEITAAHEPTEEPDVQAIAPGQWRVSAGLAIHEWADVISRLGKLSWEGSQDGITTLGGLVMAKLGRWPVTGDHVEIGNVRIEVLSMTGRRIGWLTVRLIDHENDAAQAGGGETS